VSASLVQGILDEIETMANRAIDAAEDGLPLKFSDGSYHRPLKACAAVGVCSPMPPRDGASGYRAWRLCLVSYGFGERHSTRGDRSKAPETCIGKNNLIQLCCIILSSWFIDNTVINTHRQRLIPLSQVHQHIGVAGEI
jgi:hypothetical protein